MTPCEALAAAWKRQAPEYRPFFGLSTVQRTPRVTTFLWRNYLTFEWGILTRVVPDSELASVALALLAELRTLRSLRDGPLREKVRVPRKPAQKERSVARRRKTA